MRTCYFHVWIWWFCLTKSRAGYVILTFYERAPGLKWTLMFLDNVKSSVFFAQCRLFGFLGYVTCVRREAVDVELDSEFSRVRRTV